jgi:hypothetical protein
MLGLDGSWDSCAEWLILWSFIEKFKILQNSNMIIIKSSRRNEGGCFLLIISHYSRDLVWGRQAVAFGQEKEAFEVNNLNENLNLKMRNRESNMSEKAF